MIKGGAGVVPYLGVRRRPGLPPARRRERSGPRPGPQVVADDADAVLEAGGSGVVNPDRVRPGVHVLARHEHPRDIADTARGAPAWLSHFGDLVAPQVQDLAAGRIVALSFRPHPCGGLGDIWLDCDVLSASDGDARIVLYTAARGTIGEAALTALTTPAPRQVSVRSE